MAASKQYRALSIEEKERLKVEVDRTLQKMTHGEIMKAGAKVFKKIHKQVLPTLYFPFLAVSQEGLI